MPSAFESQMAASLPALYAQMGLSAVYTDPSGSTTAVTVRVHRHDVRQVEHGRAVGEEQVADVMVLASELPKPVKAGRFVVEASTGPEAWTIEMTPVLKNGQHVCACKRSGVDSLTARRASNA